MNQTLVNDNCPYRWQYRIGGHVTVEPFFRRHIFKHPRSSIGKLVTNGTRCDREIIEFCKSTPNLQLEVSLDGIGAAQEYLRPGLSWPLVEENLKMFKEGVELIRKCSTALEKAELKVKEIVGDDDSLEEQELN